MSSEKKDELGVPVPERTVGLSATSPRHGNGSGLSASIPHAWQKLRDGTSPDRVFRGYLNHPKDWQAEYDMLLPDGQTCAGCVHVRRCTMLFGQNEADTRCQFHPTRYRVRLEADVPDRREELEP